MGYDARKTGRRIRDARKEAGMTQAALAKAIGRDAMTVSRLERGLNEPTLPTAAAICSALNVTLDSLMTDVPRNNPHKEVLDRLVALGRVWASEFVNEIGESVYVMYVSGDPLEDGATTVSGDVYRAVFRRRPKR